MKQNELFQNIDTLMTEVLELKKSWDEKVEKAEDEPSDVQEDAVHMADHGADEESLAEYAKKLSDEELHELISSLVQEAEGRGGSEGGESEEEPEAEEGQEEGESEEPEMEKADEQMPEDSEAVEMPEQDADAESSEPEEAGDLSSKVAELSDEEIQTLMSAIQAEMSSRGGGGGGGSAGSMQKSDETPGLKMHVIRTKTSRHSPYGEVERDPVYVAKNFMSRSRQGLIDAISGKIQPPKLRGWDYSEHGSEEDAPKNLNEAAHAFLSQNENWDNHVVDISNYGLHAHVDAPSKPIENRPKIAGSAPVGKSGHEESMQKSLRAALKKIDELSAQVEAFQKSQTKKVERKESMPSQKYADPKVTVLEKSVPEDSKVVMTGATLANWLISEQAAGNKKVNSDIVTKANLAKSVEDASEFYKELERIGIKAPRS